MRFDGQWLECDDGIARPVMRAEILARPGRWCALELLVDTGADRTVLSANVLAALHLDSTSPRDRIGGVGGLVDTALVKTAIRLTRDDGEKSVFRGEYAACTDQASLDMSVLGRDILEMFAAILDRQGAVVTLIGGRHQYTIQRR